MRRRCTICGTLRDRVDLASTSRYDTERNRWVSTWYCHADDTSCYAPSAASVAEAMDLIDKMMPR